MASLESQLLQRVRTDLQGINGTPGGYLYDLTTADQVVIGRKVSPTRVPCVFLAVDRVDTAQQPGTTQLNQYDRTMALTIVGFVAGTSDAPGDTTLLALDLGRDVRRALELDRSLNSLAYDVEVRMSAYQSEDLDLPSGYGVAVLEITVLYAEVSPSV